MSKSAPGACARAPEPLASRLRSGLAALGLDAPGLAAPQWSAAAGAERASMTRQFEAYLHLLQKWNRAYNLTAVRDPLRMVPRHILDSLTVLPYLRGGRCLDVGSGAGLPGLILAIAEPRRHWCLLDSNGKKTRFLRQAVTELALDNIEIAQARVRDYRPPHPFTTIVSRAYAPAAAYLRDVAHLAAPEQTILAMKAALPEEELQALRQTRVPFQIHPLTVPGLAAPRNLILARR